LKVGNPDRAPAAWVPPGPLPPCPSPPLKKERERGRKKEKEREEKRSSGDSKFSRSQLLLTTLLKKFEFYNLGSGINIHNRIVNVLSFPYSNFTKRELNFSKRFLK